MPLVLVPDMHCGAFTLLLLTFLTGVICQTVVETPFKVKSSGYNKRTVSFGGKTYVHEGILFREPFYAGVRKVFGDVAEPHLANIWRYALKHTRPRVVVNYGPPRLKPNPNQLPWNAPAFTRTLVNDVTLFPFFFTEISFFIGTCRDFYGNSSPV